MVWGYVFKAGKWVVKTHLKAAKAAKKKKKTTGRGSIEIKPQAGWNKAKKINPLSKKKVKKPRYGSGGHSYYDDPK